MDSLSNADLYKRLFDAYKKCYTYSGRSGQKIQEDCNMFWKAAKANHGKDIKSFQNQILDKIRSLNEKYATKKVNSMKFFTKASISYPSCGQRPVTTTDLNTTQQSNPPEVEKVESKTESEDDDQINKILKPKHITPAQSNTEKRITYLESQLNAELTARDSGLGGIDIDKKIKRVKSDLEMEKKKLISQKRNAEYQSKYRKKQKTLLTKICEEHPDVTKKIRLADSPGRPRLEEDQSELINAITNIAMFGSQTDERRRSQMVRSCRTLDDLHQALLKEGFELSRSATYLRLLPRDSRTNEGKKHVKTAPVKLVRATTDLHKSHVDQHFCTATIRYLENLASILGPSQVFFISQDDKARVPIGMTAAHKQSPAIMHLEYRIRLPDHDWVIAERHKLIPSVYGAMRIEKGGMGRPDAVTYSGPTYIAIRSGKHSSSTAKTHHSDFNRILQLPEFADFASKPVVIFSVDGGPDENPRYPKVIASAIKKFKELNLDAVFVATNAPGRSAFNRVERRMAPLSLPLSGLVLPHDTFGNHLDANGKTTNSDLELKNFAQAGKILSEIWSSIIIDNEPVVAEYLPPDNDDVGEMTDVLNDQHWYTRHVQESQYFLQIVKCTNKECCGDIRSDIRKILPQGFFPPPYPLRSESSLIFPSPEDVKASDHFASLFVRQSLNMEVEAPFKIVPYDFYCPSIQDALIERICSVCSKYFASKKAAQLHKKLHGRISSIKKEKALAIYSRRGKEVLCRIGADVEWMDVDDVDDVYNQLEAAPIIRDVPVADPLSEWVLSPWTENLT
ncbi:hypothetical protein ACJJTC_015982 [Scirpophaga incertulas]